MSTQKVGWCRLTEEVVTDSEIIQRPYLRDDMDVYSHTEGVWLVWKPEGSGTVSIPVQEVPEMIQLAMLMLT